MAHVELLNAGSTQVSVIRTVARPTATGLAIDLDALEELRVGRISSGTQEDDKPWLRALVDSLSRCHFSLHKRDGRWYLRDEKSTGGTFFVGGRLVGGHEEHLLTDGEEIFLGAPGPRALRLRFHAS